MTSFDEWWEEFQDYDGPLEDIGIFEPNNPNDVEPSKCPTST